MKPSGGNSRLYGSPPYRVVMVHGGPGAPGSMALPARTISHLHGVIEALQTRDTIVGLLEELHELISAKADAPVVLIGHSWGAWLSILHALCFPDEVSKLILVACPPFLERDAEGILETRLDRMGAAQAKRTMALIRQLEETSAGRQERIFSVLAANLRKADAYSPVEQDRSPEVISYSDYKRIWNEAAGLRSSGELLRKLRQVRCPVTAIHGDHDPHPVRGVEPHLREAVPDSNFILLERCGHEPWLEHHARDNFYRILERECVSPE